MCVYVCVCVRACKHKACTICLFHGLWCLSKRCTPWQMCNEHTVVHLICVHTHFITGLARCFSSTLFISSFSTITHQQHNLAIPRHMHANISNTFCDANEWKWSCIYVSCAIFRFCMQRNVIRYVKPAFMNAIYSIGSDIVAAAYYLLLMTQSLNLASSKLLTLLIQYQNIELGAWGFPLRSIGLVWKSKVNADMVHIRLVTKNKLSMLTLSMEWVSVFGKQRPVLGEHSYEDSF